MGENRVVGAWNRRPPAWQLALVGLALLAGAATLLTALEPATRLAERNLAVQASYETAAALVASLVAYLLAGRYGRTRARRDLILAAAVSVLALSNLLFTAVPDMTGARDGPFAVWASTLGTLVAASALALGSFVPDRRLPSPRRAAAVAVVAVLATVATIAAVTGALEDTLTVGIDPEKAPDEARVVGGNGVLLTLNLVAGIGYAVAAAGFLRRAAGDELLRWFAVGTLLAAFARFNYFLVPSSLSAWLSTGDVLRMAFYLALLAGAVREIGAYQRGIAVMAMLDERRRVARDLHDGLAQELAYIATASDRAAAGKASPAGLSMLGTAAQRAMEEARMLIDALAADPAPLEEALAAAAGDAAARAGIALRLEVPAGLDVPPRTREALARIVREAVNNAARHSGARNVRVTLTAQDALVLRVVDDGRGFDPAATDGGFGLTSMRDRASAVGGELRIASRPGGGTEVRVAIP